MSEFKVEDLVKRRIELRDQIEAIDKKAKADKAALTQFADTIDGFLFKKAMDDGVESFKTEHGTFFITTKEFINVEDWESTLPWLIESGRTDMLTKAISKNAVMDYINETGAPPPGIKYCSKKEGVVRRA